MTRDMHPCTQEKFDRALFKNKNPGDYFDENFMKKVLDNDNNLLSDKQFDIYISDLLKSNDVIKFCANSTDSLGDCVYMVAYTNAVNKEEALTYSGFCDFVTNWIFKGNFFTEYKLRKELEKSNIWMPYNTIRFYMMDMIHDKKMQKFKGRVYQLIIGRDKV